MRVEGLYALIERDAAVSLTTSLAKHLAAGSAVRYERCRSASERENLAQCRPNDADEVSPERTAIVIKH